MNQPRLPENSDEQNFPMRRLQPSEPSNSIVWTEREDVYKPTPKSIQEFERQRGISSGDFREVYFSRDAWNNLRRHLDSNPRIEQGGILFGNAYQDPSFGIYVEITAAIAAPATIGTVAHLEFTSDSWLSIMNYAKEKKSRDNIVGWYHSHPNHGVFMSSVDMNTQVAFFSHPWCLSVVYDPIRQERDFFLGISARRVKPAFFDTLKRSEQGYPDRVSAPPTAPPTAPAMSYPQSPLEQGYAGGFYPSSHPLDDPTSSGEGGRGDRFSLLKNPLGRIMDITFLELPFMVSVMLLWDAMMSVLNLFNMLRGWFLGIYISDDFLIKLNAISIPFNILFFLLSSSFMLRDLRQRTGGRSESRVRRR